MNRRSILLGLPAFLAAPSIVRAESLMRISVPWLTLDDLYDRAGDLGCDLVAQFREGVATAYAARRHTRGDLYTVVNMQDKIVIAHGRYVRPDAACTALVLYPAMPKEIRPEVIAMTQRRAPLWQWRAA